MPRIRRSDPAAPRRPPPPRANRQAFSAGLLPRRPWRQPGRSSPAGRPPPPVSYRVRSPLSPTPALGADGESARRSRGKLPFCSFAPAKSL
jgi:hypothetical protein